MSEVKLGKPYPIPCGHRSKIVWISKDRRVIAVKCMEGHIVEKEHWDRSIKKKTNLIYIIEVSP